MSGASKPRRQAYRGGKSEIAMVVGGSGRINIPLAGISGEILKLGGINKVESEFPARV